MNMSEWQEWDAAGERNVVGLFFFFIYPKVSNTREESQDDKRKNGAKTELKSKKCDSGIKIDENVFG